MRLVPNSNGEDARPSEVREFNTCHHPAGSPAGGQFCSTKDTMRVGITSARPGQTEGVYANMAEFERDLRRVPGVSKVSVWPGIGAWQGGYEPSWIVSYVGNGEARRLLAKTAIRYDQDAVLLMGRCKGGKENCDPAVDLRFDAPLSRAQMEAVNGVLGASGFGGWTWGKVGGKTVLRAVSVPKWGGVTSKHIKRMAIISGELTRRGFTHKHRVKWVKTDVLDRDNYTDVLRGAY